MIMRQKVWIIGGYIRKEQGWWYRPVGGDRSKKVSSQGENIVKVGERGNRERKPKSE
jgi:hypothetical protein